MQEVIIVVDTNVVVSGFLKPFSEAGTILKLILEDKIKLAFDLRILIEYEEVLKREEFNFNIKKINTIINFLKKKGKNTNALPLKKSLPDKDDNPFLEVALSAKADFLITGNKKHFPVSLCQEVKVVSPGKFLEKFVDSL
ncbi:MAG: putative toxin-antitoxin system toxin component, PIN family [Actinobacteria bacterium]|nr:putative toxin-antitoxin system toxin component, PIN family [Actinomycetota bacterium]